MPGKRAPFSDPDSILKILEKEKEVNNIELLREIVTQVCDLGPYQVRDPNPTRALAINTVATRGRRTHQFFAILTEKHKGLHGKEHIGPKGFSIQVAFRKDAGVKPSGTNWVCDRPDYIKKGNQVWYRDELRNATLDVDSIMKEVKKGRDTFLVNEGRQFAGSAG
jgi:hypothetical protein